MAHLTASFFPHALLMKLYGKALSESPLAEKGGALEVTSQAETDLCQVEGFMYDY